MTTAALLLNELVTRIRLAERSGTILLLVSREPEALEESCRLLLSLLRVTAALKIEELGQLHQRSGPVAWVSETRSRPADAVVALVRPGSALATRSFGRKLNGERENLRDLSSPLLLLMSAEDEQALREVAPDFFTWVAQGYELPPSVDLKNLAREKGALIDAVEAIAAPPIRFLHLSDLHFKTDATRVYDQDRVLAGLLDRLRKDRAASPLDLVFFTGDLANAAKAEEYRSSIDFFARLLEATGVDPSRFFIVPGNHDVDRRIGRWLLRTLRSDEESTAFFIEPESRSAHERKFLAYREALSALLGEDRGLGLGVGGDAVEVVEIRGSKIAVASFNSAWFAVADDDIEKLWLGEASVDRAAQRIRTESADLSIALMHHPTSHLAEIERSAVEKHLERSFDLVLRGHLHADKSRSIHTARGGYVELAAPAAYQGSQWPNGCYVGEIQLSPRSLSVRPYKFGAGADPWTLDASVFPDDETEGYCHTFPLQTRSGGGTIRHALGPVAADEIFQEIDRPKQTEIRAQMSGRGSLRAVGRVVTARGPDAGDLLGELESVGGKLSPLLQTKLATRLAAEIPPAPEPAPTWGPVAFDALLQRFVAYWSDHRAAWLQDLGDHASVYELATQAFFERQSGQPIRSQVRFGQYRPNFLVGPAGGEPSEQAAIEVKSGARLNAPRALERLDLYMKAANTGLGAALLFRPNRPREEQGVEPAGHGKWLVRL